MDSQTQERLLEINREFYAQNASSFSKTRRNVQPGVRQLIPSIPHNAKLLDIGCGNGNFALALAHAGFQGTYLGIDRSTAFIQEAQQAVRSPENRSRVSLSGSRFSLTALGGSVPARFI